jgi:predicted transcriptional regulator
MAKPKATPPVEKPVFDGPLEFRAWIREQCDKSSVKAVAEKVGMHPTQLSNLLAGRACLGEVMAERFGYRRVQSVRYEPIEVPK